MMARAKKILTLPAPEAVTVGGHTYAIKVDAALTVAQSKDGCCDPLTETIAINPHLPASFKTSTLVHELMEAINMTYMAESMCHDDITRLGEAFAAALADLGIEIDWG